jgi:hypothetical protein
MKLSHRKIPEQFARAMPRGFRLVQRQAQDFLLVESVFCPRGHNLVVDSVRIHDEPSVKLKVTVGDEAGFVFVDAFWGSHAKLFSFVPMMSGKEAAFADAYCPYCDASMGDRHACPEKGCSSDRGILLNLPGGKNKIHVCARLGCPGHMLDIVELPGQVVKAVSGINYFGAGTDDVLGSI